MARRTPPNAAFPDPAQIFREREGLPEPVEPARPIAELPGIGAEADMPADVRAIVDELRLRGQSERFRAAYEQSRGSVQRADASVDRLQQSLEAPLYEGVVRRSSRRPWAEMDPERNVIGYSEADVDEPEFWTPERRARTQRMLVNAGLLEGQFKYGMYDDNTRGAYRDLLTFASRQGLTVNEALLEYQRARKWADENGVPWEQVGGEGGGSTSRPAFVAPTYDAPDPVAVTQAVKELFKSRLGRNPTAQEYTQWAQTFMELGRAEFDNEVQRQRAEFDAQPGEQIDPRFAPAASGDVFDTSMPAAPSPLDEQGRESVPQFDAAARFAAAFAERYGNEEETNANRPRAAGPGVADVSSLLAGVTALTGGR